MGPGEGPLVCTRDLGEQPMAKVTGLTDGGRVEIEYEGGRLWFTKNGVFSIQAAAQMRVRSSGSPFVICTLHSGRKRAVS